MDNLNIKNLHLSYQAIYNQELCESMEEMGLIGEVEYVDEERAAGVKPYKAGPTQAEVRADEKKANKKRVESGKGKSGYGPDEKFYKPEDKKIPDKETAEWLKRTKSPYGKRITGEMGREYGSRQAAGVTRVVRGPGEPRAVKLPQEPKKPKMVKRDGKWVKEAHDYYDLILSHLLDEGYANTVESAEAIMVNMSEEWFVDIVEENMKKSPRNIEKIKQKAKERKDRRLRIQYYGKDAVGHGTGEHLRPS